MARFRYSMQSILDIKLKMETQEKQGFSAARSALDVEEERLEVLCDRKKDYEEEATRLRMGVLDRLELETNRTAILRMENYIEDQKEQVAVAERNLEAARERLTQVMKERKIHETLREKAFGIFLVEENRREGKEVDELTSYTSGKRSKEEAGSRA